MNPALEHDIKRWISKQDAESKMLPRAYLKIAIAYKGWKEDFGFIANRIPHHRIYNIYFTLEMAHKAFAMTQEIYKRFLNEPDMPEYTKIKNPTPFYLEGEPYIENGIFRNVYSLPNVEILELLLNEQKTAYQIGIWADGTVASMEYRDNPYYVPSSLLTKGVMKALIDNFGDSRLSAKQIANYIREKCLNDGLTLKGGVIHTDVSSAVQTINKAFKKASKSEDPLILGGSGFAFNRKSLPLILKI